MSDLEEFKRKLNKWLKAKHNEATEKEANAKTDYDSGFYQGIHDLTEEMRFLFCNTNNITSKEIEE